VTVLSQLTEALQDRYTIERELGRGGMATVYLADDLRHQRKVAIKVLRPELGAILGPERFTREIRNAAGLTHPHILPLYDSGEVPAGHPERSAGPPLLYYVMPYVRGESLRQKLAREKQLSVDETLAIVRQVAAALDHAHAHGLIHRDIKPENILLHEGEAMVADFGIALAAGAAAAPGERLTGTGLLVGTPEYMSPEQAAGERTLDARSDVYSLGCVLYEMLAGEPPYTGPTAQAVIAKRFTDPPPAIRRLRLAVPVAVEQAIVKALARVPADRFASAGALAEALTAPGRQPAAISLGRGAPLPQPERGPGERVLRRWHHRGRHRPAFEDPLAEGDLAHLGDAVQEAGAEPARDRGEAGRRDAARGKRAACREPGADRGAAPRCRDGPAPLDGDV
jgi:serine/threonine-protein kinase